MIVEVVAFPLRHLCLVHISLAVCTDQHGQQAHHRLRHIYQDQSQAMQLTVNLFKWGFTILFSKPILLLPTCTNFPPIYSRQYYFTRIRPSKMANTLFTSTVLFPLTKEQTPPQALVETHHSLVWNPCASEPGPSLKQVQHSSRYIFSETENYTIITDFQKRVTHFQLE